jgi:cyclic beta-1,2-glucan synthetase
LRRGLATETVVAPYASVLALPVDVDAAMKNLRRLDELGLIGDYGFYEAADFTPDRTPAGSLFVPVLSYMAHHQGMSLAAICNVLRDSPFQRWFHADRLVQASELILQERPLRVRPITDLQPRRVMSAITKAAPANAQASA